MSETVSGSVSDRTVNDGGRETGSPPLRVLVTRAVEQAGDLTERLRRLGCFVIDVPLIAVVDPVDGGAELARAMTLASRADSPYDWVVFTSPNGAERALALLGPGASARLAAIGPGTAAVCRNLGFDVALVPKRSVGEGLVESFPDPVSSFRRILLPQAEGARPVVADGLRARGWTVESVTAYRTVPRTPTPADHEIVATADVVLCASSSAARSMVAAFGVKGLPPLVVSIGPQTTNTLENLGVEVEATADPHTLDGLIGCVESILRSRS